MAKITADDATAAVDRENDIIQYSSGSVSSDIDGGFEYNTPVIDAFVEASGPSVYMKMANFSAAEFEFLWTSTISLVLANWKVGRVRKSAFSGEDVLLMLLSTLKHGGQWDFLGKMFKIKGPTFERTIINFLWVIGDRVFDQNVPGRSDVFPMAKMA